MSSPPEAKTTTISLPKFLCRFLPFLHLDSLAFFCMDLRATAVYAEKFLENFVPRFSTRTFLFPGTIPFFPPLYTLPVSSAFTAIAVVIFLSSRSVVPWD